MAGLTAKEDLNGPIQSSASYIGYYFPVRYKGNKTTEGAWLQSYKQEQRRRFKAILCKNYKTLDEIKSHVHGTQQKLERDYQMQDEEPVKKLNGFFLLKHCQAEDPTEVFAININDEGLNDVCVEDFLLFDKVQCISARENRLELEAFNNFSHLQELELPLNAINRLKLKYGNFPYLQHLDLSFNNLPGNTLKSLGLMPNLLTLNLSGNGITELPTDFGKSFRLSSNNLRYLRFPRLRILKLDHNKLWHPEIFVALANLPQLEHVDLEHNLLYHVPQLFNQDGRIVLYEDLPHSYLEEECSASDINDTNRNISANSMNWMNNNNNKDKENTEDDPKMETKEETEEFPDSLLSDLNEDDSDLADEIPSDIFAQSPVHLNNKERLSERSIVPVGTSIETQETEKSYCYQTQPVRFYDKTRQPFSQLLTLNLANNRFCQEEALLAIAAWPKIQALSIHGNPILRNKQMKNMTYLKRILIQKLGISILSQRPCVPSHHHTEIVPKLLRMVKDNVRKLPKLTVDQLLALESSKGDQTLTPGQSSRIPPMTGRSGPSASRASSRPFSGGYSEKDERLNSERSAENYETDADEMSETYDSVEQEMAFFMTQPCDESVPTGNEKPIPKSRKFTIPKELQQTQFKEYEILFEEDEEDPNSVQPLKDMRSNLQALQFALDHQCTVLDQPMNLRSVAVHSPKPPKQLPSDLTPMLTYEERVANVLENVKQETAIKEVLLSDVYKDPKTYKEEFREANKLLKEIKRNYLKKTADKAGLKNSDEG